MHALVVGGTGMLSGAVLYLISKGFTVSVVARHTKSFERLLKLSGNLSSMINVIKVDYTDTMLLIQKLENAINKYGAYTLAVSWIHSSAPEAVFKIAELLESKFTKCRFFDLLGSSASDPLNEINLRDEKFSKYKNIAYRRIILGYKADNGSSRWLTNDEISEGVINAIIQDKETYVVGTVEPWSARP
ncbi:MAG: short-chain dehydrogenase [Ignavibacteria bacterium]